MSDLSPRELRALQLIADGYTIDEMSREFHVSATTYKNQINAILTALGARNRNHAVAIAYRKGILGDGTAEDLAVVRLAREMGYRIALVPRGRPNGTGSQA